MNLNSNQKVKVLVVGDVMLDRYWWGNVSRVSPEAPVPVVNLERISSTLGGAANVAANVCGLGAEAYLIGVVGDDSEAEIVFNKLNENNLSSDFLIKSCKRETIVKTRVIAHNQQIVRVDQETNNQIEQELEDAVWDKIVSLINSIDVIIVSDYAKGVLTEKLLSRLIRKAVRLDKIILIDPKGKDFSKYSSATMITPNRSEMVEACQIEFYDQSTLEAEGRKLLSKLGLKYLLITQGEDGMTLIEKNVESIHLPVELRNVYDVTGAGDTVIACLGVAMGKGEKFFDAARLANRAAGLVIEKVGTTAINLEMLNQLERGVNSNF